MKSIILPIAVLGVLSLLSAPLMAYDGMYPNIVQVNHYYHGGYHSGYYGGWNAYQVYAPPPQVCEYPTAQSTMFPNSPPWPIHAFRPAPYYYPSAGFYYANPNIAVGVRF